MRWMGSGAVAAVAACAGIAFAQAPAKSWTFSSPSDLSGWTTRGDVSIDPAQGRTEKTGALKVGPGGRAVFTLGEKDGSGTVEMWVYDDGTSPENPKAYRQGPRWGIMQKDGKMGLIAVLYAPYLGGNEGYTWTVSDGSRWYDNMAWLGINRAPAGWRRWTFVFDPEKGLQVLLNGSPVGRIDPTKVGMQGFSSIVILGDSGDGRQQTLWVDDVSATALGQVVSVPQPKPVAPRVEGPNPWGPSGQKVALYTKERPPATPKLEDLPLKTSVTQYGITWTFDRPARVGQFVNGDWYVVGPVTVVGIDPKPLYGSEIPEIELDHMDLERPVNQRLRNGFMLNPPARQRVAYDSGIRNWWDPSLIQRLPVAMKPGDALVSTISMPKGLVLQAQLRNKEERGEGDASPVRTAAILTCVAAPQPPDAFRPGFCDRSQRIYLSRNLRRELLPRVAAPAGMPPVDLYVRFTMRPWINTGFFGFETPVENMPYYGLEYGRVVGNAALILCTDLKPEEKEPLLVNLVQIGIDYGSVIRGGHPGWPAWGGHGSGRKLPVVFAGIMLGDDELANINRSFPAVSFGEDEQTAYGDCWTGAKVVFAGHSGIDAATGAGRSRGSGWGPYEHMHPREWKDGQNTSESYRRCCTSVGWIAQALALRLMKAEKQWAHDPFFDYCDRWMYEDDTEFVKVIKEATGRDHSADWARQGQCWDGFVNEMWKRYRPALPAPIDGWKKQHDDTAYRTAVEKMK